MQKVCRTEQYRNTAIVQERTTIDTKVITEDAVLGSKYSDVKQNEKKKNAHAKKKKKKLKT